MNLQAASIIFLLLAFQHLTISKTTATSSPNNGERMEPSDQELMKLDTISEEEVLFLSFIQKFNKTYSHGTSEYDKRFVIFKKSLPRYEMLNMLSSHPQHAQYGITKFSDLTQEEFRTRYLGRMDLHPDVVSINSYDKKELIQSAKTIPKRYDLRSFKPPVLSSVRNQKSCGACWAFSVVETMETKVAMATKRVTELSPQMLVDCGTAAGDSGCHGGIPCKTLGWLNRTKTRVVPEARYPYKAKKGLCEVLSNYSNSAIVSNYSCGVYSKNETLVMPSLLYNHGPLSIAVDAESWQYYLGGIIQYHCTPKFLNHAVQIVGYDTTGEIPYYIVRNSWGPAWGINGYLYIRIGGNVCGVASSVQTVSVQ